jgi:hypothetical protein
LLTEKRPGTEVVVPLIVVLIESIATVPNVNGAGLVGKVIVTRPPTGNALVADSVKEAVTFAGLPASLSGATVRLARFTVAPASDPGVTVAAPLARPVSMSVPVAPPSPGARVVIVKFAERPATCGSRTVPTVTTTQAPDGMVVESGRVTKYGTDEVGVPGEPVAPLMVVAPPGSAVVHAAPDAGT